MKTFAFALLFSLSGVFVGATITVAKYEAPAPVAPAVDWEKRYAELQNWLRVTPQCRRYWTNS